METTRTKIDDPVTVKMTKAKLMDLSYKHKGELQVRKNNGITEFFQWNYPSLRETVKVIFCTWSYGKATIPRKWLDEPVHTISQSQTRKTKRIVAKSL